jgi:thiosulfate dehydrogenase (quinone) large subunit
MSTLRKYAGVVAALAALVLIYMENPWVTPPAGLDGYLGLAFWILAILVVVALFEDRKAPQAETVQVEGPAFTRYLFSNTAAGLFWLPIRLFVGFSWLEAGIHKLFPAGKAIGAGWLDGGTSLAGYWSKAVTIPDTGSAPIAFDWYRDFLNFLIGIHAETWFGYLIVFGEIAVGLGLLFGILTGIASLFGATMNMSYLLAGSASSNPVLFLASIGLVMAWRVAGYIGLDRYLLPMLGVPWHAKVETAPTSTGVATAPARS